MTRRNNFHLNDIERRFIHGDDLPDTIPVEQIAGFLPAPGQDDPPSVAIHYVSAGQPMFENVQSLLGLSTDKRLRAHVIGVTSGPYMDQGRNRATFNCLSLTADEWMLCLDDDVAKPASMADDILALVDFAVRHRAHVVGGCYASPHDGRNFVVAYRHPDGPDGAVDLDSYRDLTVEEVDAMNPDDPTSCHIAAVGTGFLLVHRSILELMMHVYSAPQPWFAELTVNDAGDTNSGLGTHLGEDLTFCRRLWAMGIPVHLHPVVRLTHFKKVGITLPPHPSAVPS